MCISLFNVPAINNLPFCVSCCSLSSVTPRDLTMGRIFLDHIGGTRLFSCANCDTILTNRSELISTRFTGATGRAFLFNKVHLTLAVVTRGLLIQISGILGSMLTKLLARKTHIQYGVPCLNSECACLCLNPTGGEPPVQRGAGQSDAHRETHGEGRQLQELQQQAGLDLRVCY